MYIWVLFFVLIAFVVNHTFNPMPTERLQQHPLLIIMNHTNKNRLELFSRLFEESPA